MKHNGIEYSKPVHEQFIKDMRKAGLDPYLYHGRYFWHGPAVDVDNLQDALSETKVRCQWDNMGLGFVVYPKVGDGTLRGMRDETDDEAEPVK